MKMMLLDRGPAEMFRRLRALAVLLMFGIVLLGGNPVDATAGVFCSNDTVMCTDDVEQCVDDDLNQPCHAHGQQQCPGVWKCLPAIESGCDDATPFGKVCVVGGSSQT